MCPTAMALALFPVATSIRGWNVPSPRPRKMLTVPFVFARRLSPAWFATAMSMMPSRLKSANTSSGLPPEPSDDLTAVSYE